MQERHLDPEERVLDLVAYWQRLYAEEKTKGEDGTAKKKKKHLSGNNFARIVFKVHQYYEPQPGDTAAEDMMYKQAVFDVVSGRYPCGEKICVQLAGMQLQAEYGDAGMSAGDLKEKLSRYLPTKLSEGTRGSELSNAIKQNQAPHAGKSALQMQVSAAAGVYSGARRVCCGPPALAHLPSAAGHKPCHFLRLSPHRYAPAE